MKKVTRTILSMLCTAALAGCSQKLKFGTAGIGGNYHAFGEKFAEIAKEKAGMEIDVRETAGSAANLRLLKDNYIQLAIAQMDVVSEAYDPSFSGYSAIAGLYTEYVQIAASDASIASVSDLRGKTVSIGEEESGTERNAKQVLQAYGLSDTLVRTKNMSYAQAAEAMKDGEIDAMFVTAGVQTAVLEDLARNMSISFISLDQNAVSILTESYAFYSDGVIPAGTYTGQNADVRTVGIPSVLLVYSLVKSIEIMQSSLCFFRKIPSGA